MGRWNEIYIERERSCTLRERERVEGENNNNRKQWWMIAVYQRKRSPTVFFRSFPKGNGMVNGRDLRWKAHFRNSLNDDSLGFRNDLSVLGWSTKHTAGMGLTEWTFLSDRNHAYQPNPMFLLDKRNTLMIIDGNNKLLSYTVYSSAKAVLPLFGKRPSLAISARILNTASIFPSLQFIPTRTFASSASLS